MVNIVMCMLVNLLLFQFIDMDFKKWLDDVQKLHLLTYYILTG